MKKFFVRTLTHVSFAATGLCWETTKMRQRITARGKTKRLITIAGVKASQDHKFSQDLRDDPAHLINL
jgi:ureidoglycolate hydrolase